MIFCTGRRTSTVSPFLETSSSVRPTRVFCGPHRNRPPKNSLFAFGALSVSRATFILYVVKNLLIVYEKPFSKKYDKVDYNLITISYLIICAWHALC